MAGVATRGCPATRFRLVCGPQFALGYPGAMGFETSDGRGLSDLASEMTAELAEAGPAPREPQAVDWTSLRDQRVQAMLLGLVHELGEASRADIQARIAHLPQLAQRIPRFCSWACRQELLRTVRHGDQGKYFTLGPKAEAFLARWGPVAPPPGSTPLEVR
jgi:hypothetical protein